MKEPSEAEKEALMSLGAESLFVVAHEWLLEQVLGCNLYSTEMFTWLMKGIVILPPKLSKSFKEAMVEAIKLKRDQLIEKFDLEETGEINIIAAAATMIVMSREDKELPDIKDLLKDIRELDDVDGIDKILRDIEDVITTSVYDWNTWNDINCALQDLNGKDFAARKKKEIDRVIRIVLNNQPE